MGANSKKAKLDKRFIINTNDELLKSLTFKIAQTEDEIRQAFQILHDGYVSRGVMHPESHGMRVTRYHFLPTTSLLIAKRGNEVIATVTLIRDNPLGLPLEDGWSIDFLRAQGYVLCEVSALTIKENYRSGQGKILFPLIKFLSRYAVECCNVDMFVISVQAQSKRFYSNFLNFKNLSDDVKEYAFVEGEPSVGLYADIKGWKSLGEQVNRGEVSCKTAHEKTSEFLFNDELMNNMIFPQRKYQAASDPSLSTYLIDSFSRLPVGSKPLLSVTDKIVLNSLYNEPFFREEDSQGIPDFSDKRKEPRVFANIDVSLTGAMSPQSPERMRFINVSRSGAAVATSKSLDVGSWLTLTCHLGHDRDLKIKGKVVSNHGQGLYGLMWAEHFVPKAWQDLVLLLIEHYRLDSQPRKAG